MVGIKLGLKKVAKYFLKIGFYVHCSIPILRHEQFFFLTAIYGAAIPPILAHRDEKPTPIVLCKDTNENKQVKIPFILM